MKGWIAFWNILLKDMRSYYLKPPNVSWGLIFPLAWTAMFFIRSGRGFESIPALLPGVMGVSVLFGTTSMLAVTVTFEKKGRSFERLLLAPIPLEILMLAKTSGAILFGTVNAFVPVAIAAFLTDLSGVAWGALVPAVILIAVSFHVSRSLHRRGGERGLRGPDLLQLFPLPDDIPLRPLHSPGSPAPCLAHALLSSPSYLRRGHFARRRESYRHNASPRGFRPPGSLLPGTLPRQPPEHQAEMDSMRFRRSSSITFVIGHRVF